MSRTLSITNVYSKKHHPFEFDGVWADVLGTPSRNGIWLIWGSAKNGKTWFALKLANYLSQHERTLYISAEEGTELEFVSNCKRAGITIDNKVLKVKGYTEILKLKELLDKRRPPKIVFLDNLTVYKEELKSGTLLKLIRKYDKTLFVILSHEDRGKPYPATAVLSERLAKVIVYVKGLTCFVSGRVPGGTLVIDETKAKLFHGNEIKENV